MGNYLIKNEKSKSEKLIEMLCEYDLDSHYKIDELIKEIGTVSDQEKLELEKYLLFYYYNKMGLDEKSNFERNLEVLIKKNNNTIVILLLHYYKKTSFFNEIYSEKFDDVKNKVEELNKKSNDVKNEVEELNKKSIKINEELKNSKFDIIGIIAGVLSIFTVFGLNFNFFKDLLLQNEKKFFILWVIFNLVLILIIRLMFSSIKEYFYNKNDDVKVFNLGYKRNKENKGNLNIQILGNTNIILILCVACLFFYYNKYYI